MNLIDINFVSLVNHPNMYIYIGFHMFTMKYDGIYSIYGIILEQSDWFMYAFLRFCI